MPYLTESRAKSAIRWLRQAGAFYFVLIVISMVCGGLSIPGIAVASTPNSPSTSTSFSAAAERSPCSWILGCVGSIAHSMTTPVGYRTVAVAVPATGSMSHPAALRGAARTRANISLSGVDGEALTVPRCFGRPESLTVSSFCWACVSLRGAIRTSILTRASRSCSAFSFASAARALASATSRLSAASLTFDETMIPNVAITPTISAQIKSQLAQKEINSAQGRDIPIPRPFLFLLPGVVGVVIAGGFTMFFLWRSGRR